MTISPYLDRPLRTIAEVLATATKEATTMIRYSCPECGADYESLRTEYTIVGRIMMANNGNVFPDIRIGDAELVDAARTLCVECDYEGKLSEFKT